MLPWPWPCCDGAHHVLVRTSRPARSTPAHRRRRIVAVLAPVLAMARRHPQVHRLAAAPPPRAALHDHRLRDDHLRLREAADVDAAVDAGLADADRHADVGGAAPAGRGQRRRVMAPELHAGPVRSQTHELTPSSAATQRRAALPSARSARSAARCTRRRSRLPPCATLRQRASASSQGQKRRLVAQVELGHRAAARCSSQAHAPGPASSSPCSVCTLARRPLAQQLAPPAAACR